MSAALINAVLVVGFLAMYVMAGEILVGVRRQRRRRRLHGAHAAAKPHWTLMADEVLPSAPGEPADRAA